MTSSDAAPEPAPEPMPTPTPTATPGVEPIVLARGHLDPLVLGLRFLDGLRGSILPVILGLATGEYWLLVAAGVFFVLSMLHALVRYVTFEYRLTTDELITREGILERRERRIPQNRIQDLSFEATLLRRMLGLVVVSVETASGQGAEARLDSLSRRDGEQLREALLAVRTSRDGSTSGTGMDVAHAAVPVPAPPEELLLWRAGAGELSLLGLTNNRVGAILIGLFAAYELASEVGFAQQAQGLVGSMIDRLAAMQWVVATALVLAACLGALLGGWALSVAGSFMMFHDFRLTLRADVLLRRYGLFTTRTQALPRRKVQRVLLEQTWLRRWLGLVVLRADSAGSGMNPREETRGGLDIVAPLATRAVAEGLVPFVLPGVEPAQLVWQGVSSRVVHRHAAFWTVVGIVAAGVAAPFVGWLAAFAVLCPLFGLAIGILLYHNLAYARIDGHVAMRFGLLGRTRALVPLRKVQAVAVRAGPIDRLFGLATVTVYVAGGSPTQLSNLVADDARALAYDLARHAAASRFVW